MKIDYTIEKSKIRIRRLEPGEDQPRLLKLYESRLPGISFLHIKGFIRKRMQTAFEASAETGIILSIQSISQNSRFEFESYNSISANFASSIESAQLIAVNTSFRHGYENPVSINRLDIYIDPETAALPISGKVLAQLRTQRILNLSVSPNKFLPSMNEYLNLLVKELEKPKSKSLPRFFEKLIQSVIPQPS